MPSKSATSNQEDSTDEVAIPAKSDEENCTAVCAMLQEFLKDGKRAKESMRNQLKMLLVNQRIMVQEMAHIWTAELFARLGFVDVNVNSDKYTHQYNAKMITLIMERDIQELSRNEDIDIHAPVMSFRCQQALIAKRLGKSMGNVTEKQINEDILLPKKVKKAKLVKIEKIEDKILHSGKTAKPGGAQGSAAPMQTTPDNNPHMVNVNEL
ncbi:hypothetical protein ARMGADRAFT_1029622 [Armillaria gallica]|uniref:Uncharacterized protein n=1 Tax=Armillaria gallica TaxID=47427 RepID=A0A2H3DH41_ARMGA|nr:hypothetical protein ARMGADRAFT_1029622 [Armillaria gallica]